MAIVIRTADLPPGRRRAAWRELVCEVLGPLEIRIDHADPLQGEVVAGSVGSLGVGKVRTVTRHSVYRTAALVRDDDPPMHRLVLAVSGRVQVEQDRRAQLRPGEFTIYDFARPYKVAYHEAVELAVFSFPRGSLALPADELVRLAALPLSGAEGTTGLAASVLRRVAAEQESYGPSSAARVSTVVADLVSAALAERLGAPDVVPVESRERVLLVSIQAFIDQHLGDVGLDPGTIAAAHHVSLRHLHRLFESHSTTVAAWVRQRRLERSQADLVDPVLVHRPVSEVGARWGLADPAHFSRLFRRAYGVSPTQYRRAHLGLPV